MIRVGLALGASWLGSVNYYRNLLNAIRELPGRQIEPVLVLGAQTDPGVLVGLPELEVIRSPWLDPLTVRWAVRKVGQQVLARDPTLERVLRSYRIDVLSHSDFLGPDATIPAICWIGDLQHRQLPQYFSRAERLYRDRDFRLQCRHATRILVSSNDVRRELATFEPMSLEKSRVLPFVAQPAVDGEGTDRATLETRYDFSGPYFHVPNQFWAHKNHQLILDALTILRERGQPALVISTGATEDYRRPGYFAELMARARALGVEHDFRTLGVVPYPDLVGLMVSAVAMINPSRSEGWSTSVEEAKSLGKRIILSDLPVHREQAPLDGIYVDLDDPIDLAGAMQQVRATFDSSTEVRRAERARRELPGRVRAFAEAYQEIVIEAVEGLRHSTGSPGLPAGPDPTDAHEPALRRMALRCPRCSGGLRASDRGWSCEACPWEGAIDRGVPVLVPDPTLADHDDVHHSKSHGHKEAQAAHFDQAMEVAFETDRPHGSPRLYQYLIGEKFRRAVDPIRPHVVGTSALTVCGGSGMDAEYWSRAGANVVSSDLSVGAAKRAKARFEKRALPIESVVADVEHLPFGDQSVDLVAVHDGLHHLDDPYAGLSEMARVARRWVVVSEPGRAFFTRLAIRLGLALEFEEAGNRVMRLEPSSVAAFLEARGYVLLRSQRYLMYYPHHPGRAFRLLSRPSVFPMVRTAWRVANAFLGRYGNKMVVVAERGDRPR